MALSARLALRQSQAMVLTPQLLQAIKLLQMPNLELTQFIENELASNPLLERAEEREEASFEQVEPQAVGFAEAAPEPGDWAREALGTDTGHLAANLGTEVENRGRRPCSAVRQQPSSTQLSRVPRWRPRQFECLYPPPMPCKRPRTP